MDLLLKQCESAINRFLSMDPETLNELAPYAGRSMNVEVRDTRYFFHVTIVEGGISLDGRPAADPDVTVRGTPSEFMAFLRAHHAESGSAAGSIEIAGNVTMAQEIQAVARRLDPDWEEYLSRWFGDGPARKLGNLFRSSGRFLLDSGKTLEADISEYLRYETGVLPDRSEVEEFNAEVDTLRNDVERLRARIKRLQQSGKS